MDEAVGTDQLVDIASREPPVYYLCPQRGLEVGQYL